MAWGAGVEFVTGQTAALPTSDRAKIVGCYETAILAVWDPTMSLERLPALALIMALQV